MFNCSQGPSPDPLTLMPSSQTACMDWLPLYSTSKGEMGRPSLYICQDGGSATAGLGANCTHMAWYHTQMYSHLAAAPIALT